MKGRHVKELRQTLNITQGDFADLIGITQPTLCKIEGDASGEVKTKYIPVILKAKERLKEKAISSLLEEIKYLEEKIQKVKDL